jgi:hypothetical protein
MKKGFKKLIGFFETIVKYGALFIVIIRIIKFAIQEFKKLDLSKDYVDNLVLDVEKTKTEENEK